MDKFRRFLIIFAAVLIIVQVCTMDFVNHTWKANDGNYIGIFSMVFLIISMVLSNRYDKKQTN